MCVIKSMYTFNPTHTPARSLFHTGSVLATRPSVGSWISYGLGTENENLPAFVALTPGGNAGGGGNPIARNGFLPSEYQGIPFNDVETEPEKMIPNLRNRWADPKQLREQVDEVQKLNGLFNSSFGADDYLEGPHQIDGSRLPHAIRSDGRLRYPQRARSGSRRVWPDPVRQRLPAGPPAGGARRPLYPRQLWSGAGVGRPQGHQEEPAASAAPIWTRPRPR